MVVFISTLKDMNQGRFLELAYSAMNEAEYEDKQNLFIPKKTDDYGEAMSFLDKMKEPIKKS